MNVIYTTETYKEKNILKVKICGNLDITNCNSIKKEILNKIDNEHIVIFDFNDVNSIDSSGIGTLIYIYNKLKEKELNIKIMNVSGYVKDVFVRSRVHHLFSIYENEKELYNSI